MGGTIGHCRTSTCGATGTCTCGCSACMLCRNMTATKAARHSDSRVHCHEESCGDLWEGQCHCACDPCLILTLAVRVNKLARWLEQAADFLALAGNEAAATELRKRMKGHR